MEGFLGPAADPWFVKCDPSVDDFKIGELALPAGMSLSRLGGRRTLLDVVSRRFDKVQRGSTQTCYGRFTEEEFGLISGNCVRSAFDLSTETPAVRDRYGRHKFGQGCLLARRLIEADVSLVQLN